MFEEISTAALQTLIFLFWITIAFLIIGGALWTRAYKNSK